MSILFEDTSNDTRPLNQYITESLIGHFWSGHYKLTQKSITFTFTHKNDSQKIISVKIISDSEDLEKPRESIFADINVGDLQFIMNPPEQDSIKGNKCETDEKWMNKPVSEYDLRLLATFSPQPPKGDKPAYQSCIRRKPQGGAKGGTQYVKTDSKCKCKDGVTRTIYVKNSQKGGTSDYVKKRNTNGSYDFIHVNQI